MLQITSDPDLQIDGFHGAGALDVTAFEGSDPLVLRKPDGAEALDALHPFRHLPMPPTTGDSAGLRLTVTNAGP